QLESAAQQEFSLQLHEREQKLLLRESLVLKHEQALSKIKGVEEEVRTRIRIMKELHELNEQNKKLESQAKKVQARLDNLQRKYEFSMAQKIRDSIPTAVQELKQPKQEKPQASHKTSKISANSNIYELLAILMDWISDSHLCNLKLEDESDNKEILALNTSPNNCMEEKCTKLLPILAEQLQQMAGVHIRLQIPLVKFIYWSLRQLDSKSRLTALVSTTRRLGEEVYKGTMSPAVLDEAPEQTANFKTKPAVYFKSPILHMRFLSTLIVLKTVSQADYLAQAFDTLLRDLKNNEGKSLFLEYQALNVVLKHAGSSWLLNQFLEACSNEHFFRVMSLLLRNPKLEVELLEKASIILQKLSKMKSDEAVPLQGQPRTLFFSQLEITMNSLMRRDKSWQPNAGLNAHVLYKACTGSTEERSILYVQVQQPKEELSSLESIMRTPTFGKAILFRTETAAEHEKVGRKSVFVSEKRETPRELGLTYPEVSDQNSGILAHQEFRIKIITWNVGSTAPTRDFISWLACSVQEGNIDMYVIGLQEVCILPKIRLKESTFSHQWKKQLSHALAPFGYSLCNKGGVCIKMTLYGHALCFLNVHLPHHIQKYEARIRALKKITKRQFPGKSPYQDFDKTTAFLFGDLNFRIDDLDINFVKMKIGEKDLSKLWESDQLNKAKKIEDIFAGFQEGVLNFPPTYKFDVGSNVHDTSMKMRKPAWTDRILWRIKNVTTAHLQGRSPAGSNISVIQESYESHMQFQSSDHKPVSSVFMVKMRPIESAMDEIAKYCFSLLCISMIMIAKIGEAGIIS
ncbi:CC138 protein, partial [Polypterus senegalus]